MFSQNQKWCYNPVIFRNIVTASLRKAIVGLISPVLGTCFCNSKRYVHIFYNCSRLYRTKVLTMIGCDVTLWYCKFAENNLLCILTSFKCIRVYLLIKPAATSSSRSRRNHPTFKKNQMLKTKVHSIFPIRNTQSFVCAHLLCSLEKGGTFDFWGLITKNSLDWLDWIVYI